MLLSEAPSERDHLLLHVARNGSTALIGRLDEVLADTTPMMRSLA